MKIFRKSLQVLTHIYKSFFANDCANRAASMAYTTLLSLVPMLMLSFWILSLFPAFSGTGQDFKQFIVKNFVAHSAQMMADQLDHFIQQVKVLSWSSLVALAIVAVLMIYDMVSAFNSIWHVKEKRGFLASLFSYTLFLILAPIGFGIFMVGSSYLATLSFVTHVQFLEKPLLYILPYLSALVIFTFFNWALPSCKVPLRNALIAGFITTVLFEGTKYLFGLYMSLFPTYRLIYGALATIPIFLLWIYICWVILLLGAVICQTLTKGIEVTSFLSS